MKNLIYLIFGIAALAASCSDNNGGHRSEQARELYEKSLKLGLIYTDSISCAQDSSEVMRLSNAYEEELTKLNYHYQPELDLEISEGENDTLMRVSTKLVEIKDSILKKLGKPTELPDSVLSDDFHLAS